MSVSIDLEEMMNFCRKHRVLIGSFVGIGKYCKWPIDSFDMVCPSRNDMTFSTYIYITFIGNGNICSDKSLCFNKEA
jgi:hypothetical protein